MVPDHSARPIQIDLELFYPRKALFPLPLFNSLPNKKLLDWSKFEGFVNDKINVNEKLKFILERVENIVGKGEKAG